MKLLAGLILGAVVAEDYYYTDDYGERKKKKKKNVKSDACGCSEMPRNAPDAVATCVEVNLLTLIGFRNIVLGRQKKNYRLDVSKHRNSGKND